MCEPTTVIAALGLVLGAAGQVAESNAQQKTLDQTAKAQASEQSSALQQEVGERVAEARRQRSSLLVAQGESGLSLGSNSFEAQLANSFASQNKDLAVAATNARFATNGIKVRADAEASGIRSGLQIGGAALGGAGAVAANRQERNRSLEIT